MVSRRSRICMRKALSGLEGLLEIVLERVGLEVMADSVSAGTHSDSWRKRISDRRSGNC